MITKLHEVDPSTISSSSDLLPHLVGVASYVGQRISDLEAVGRTIDTETSGSYRPERISSRRVSFPQASPFDGTPISRLVARVDNQGNAMLASAPPWDETYGTVFYTEVYIPGDELIRQLARTEPCLWDVQDAASAFIDGKIVYPFCSYLYRQHNPTRYASALQRLTAELDELAPCKDIELGIHGCDPDPPSRLHTFRHDQKT